MSKQYHYLISGLPDLIFDDTKLRVSLRNLRDLLSENLTKEHFKLIRLYFWRYDHKNILDKLAKSESSSDFPGNLSESDIDTLFDDIKNGSFIAEENGIPAYIGEFISAYRNETPLFEGKSRELELSELYYNYATTRKNAFVSKWFEFERDLQNILTASQCRKYGVSPENQLIGSSELTNKLIRSQAKDFGLDNDFPMLNQIVKALDEHDLIEQEKMIDRLKWDYLTDEEFFHYFSVEKLFSFLVKLTIADRWISLDRETGKVLLNELLSNMESSYEFPEEFKSGVLK